MSSWVLERHKKKKKKKLRRGIPLSASVCCSLWMMHILEPPLTPVGNQVGQEIKKEKNEEKKREFRNVEQDKWAFFFLFFWWRQPVWPVNNASSTALHQCFFFEFSVLRKFATWQSVLELELPHGRTEGLSVQLHGAKICS